ncbi:hypothetical protein [Bradyrhizobium sp. NP1]|uniref:hypothetical protein n=1 Tax=Bradyrhizobium sp. NP1 TaxID=3049772 RepID=UPI0025A67853|nr:hypothetical protein [Bradyrhizobium sp. NP1]WJR75895.1 hypothetical protein QOU61_24325 [Bradyrhizobium sp. NP1]
MKAAGKFTIFGERQFLGPLKMAQAKFEPFGEQIDLTEKSLERTGASKWLVWVGSSAFWAFAVTIIVARAVYFQPGIFDEFVRVVSLFRGF